MSVRCAFLFPLALVTACAGPTIARAADGPQTITLTTGDGARLSARYFPGNQGGKSPTVLILDNLGDDARPAMCDDVARQLVKEGCTVLCFDFRGCGRSKEVDPEFWEDGNNRQMVKGYKADSPPETIRFADFKAGYLPTLINDVAAARAYMERRNDARECNIGLTYVIGFGRGATLGQIWLASEWSRHRVSGVQNKIASKPEGRDIAGCIWIDPALAFDRLVPMLDLMKKPLAKKSSLVGLILADGDGAKSRFARQCQDVFNAGRRPLIAVHSIAVGRSSPHGEVTEWIGKFVANMRKTQELPPWDDRNFGDRRYVWVFPGSTIIAAKDEGDDQFQPLPVEQLLGKR